jgi:RNA polymerase sigma-70 factor (ECF subfamily)
VASIVRAALMQHDRRLYGYALSLTGDPDVAAELFQDCALRALSAKRVPTEPRACRAWLFVILRNLWHDRLRHNQAVSRVVADACFELPTILPEEQYIDAIAVRAAMARISPTLRDTLALVDIAGFRYAEAAEILAVPIGTVMSRMSEARRKLAALIVQENSNVVDHPAARKQRA